MRSRILDVILLVGLVAVAGGIMWTLFNLGGGPRQAQPSTPAASDGPSAGNDLPSAGNAIVPIVPGADPAASNGVVPIDPGAVGGQPAAGDAGLPGAGSDVGALDPVQTPPVTPTPPRILPDGSVELERVGFSYVTGGAGACSVVLEAWLHVAVSRDLLAEYGCGATVSVTLDDPAGGRSEVQAVIGDTMNPVHSNTVNIYVGQDEDALSYGVTTGTLTAR